MLRLRVLGKNVNSYVEGISFDRICELIELIKYVKIR